MINKEKLNSYAEKLMFRMNEEEYDTLLEEFEVIEKQMDLIGQIEGINEVKSMIFPYELNEVKMREDKVEESLSIEDALKNAKNIDKNQIEVPKVVE